MSAIYFIATEPGSERSPAHPAPLPGNPTGSPLTVVRWVDLPDAPYLTVPQIEGIPNASLPSIGVQLLGASPSTRSLTIGLTIPDCRTAPRVWLSETPRWIEVAATARSTGSTCAGSSFAFRRYVIHLSHPLGTRKVYAP